MCFKVLLTRPILSEVSSTSLTDNLLSYKDLRSFRYCSHPACETMSSTYLLPMANWAERSRLALNRTHRFV